MFLQCPFAQPLSFNYVTAKQQANKKNQKIFTRTNFTQIFLQVVPRHIPVCQQSTQGGCTVMAES